MKKTVKIQSDKSLISSKEKQAASSVFPIVGIGASAGGLEALELFLKNISPDCGIAFVVIQHLSPNYVGMMPELLQRVTEMKVIQVHDKIQIKPNEVYVIPPNKLMSIFKGILLLHDFETRQGVQLPINYFFESLAENLHEKSIGVILSGMGSDGSDGILAIKKQQGIALAQDPDDAKFDGMPKSAINTGMVDIVGPAGELAGKLISFIENMSTEEDLQGAEIESKNNLGKILYLLKQHSGHDFSMYKKSTLSRRVERRIQVHQINGLSNYVRFLQANPAEMDILFKEFLIGVTNFFRDKAVWENLSEEILPELCKKLPAGGIIRAWVTGCSTGEEAYSLAIALQEVCDKNEPLKALKFQIFATDIDVEAIDKARKGFYKKTIASDVSSQQLHQYFIKEDNGYRINNIIREMVVFAPHNVIKDPPFTKLDLLFCRNLLIYMEPELQKKLMNLFYYSLNPEGILLLGNSESENGKEGQFKPIHPKLKLYQRASLPINITTLEFPASITNNNKPMAARSKSNDPVENIQFITEQILLQRHSPASVLINANGDILNITGRTGKYLEPAAGKANWNIYAMAREGLNHELPGAIRKAKLNFDPLVIPNITIGTNGGTQIVDITLQQIERPDLVKGTILIVFSDVKIKSKTVRTKTAKSRANATDYEKELEMELKRTKDELQHSREEMQTTQEELKSANEEMQSTNEELQSTNEELTTSKEELQSLNEELQTVNIELQSKVTEFTVSNNDMKNLLNSTDIATLFLDKKLNIRRFTDQLTKLFKLRVSDIGRPITDMVSTLNYPDMVEHANLVLTTLKFKETAISASDNNWFLIRIMPYRTFDDRIDGLVITFIEITSTKQMEEKLNRAITILRSNNLWEP